jgi:hypothetical protein
VIVDDLNTAKEVLSLNQQIKGGVINIYPLSIMDQVHDQKDKAYPQM